MVGYRQTNQKTDTGKTLTRWPVFVDHFSAAEGGEAAFSPKAIPFIKDISSHKKMILGFEPYGSTMQVVEFDLTGADSIAKEISSSCKWKK
ncbi:hypothetical protein [Klebsiella pneumoniae]|uniref:hypothetical protein n=1 Tax=Klebsiella pneumoniae TaxID=573 RepID=UPI0022EAC403|nr:hypothetical protein [Klebsiella pneumoniae]